MDEAEFLIDQENRVVGPEDFGGDDEGGFSYEAPNVIDITPESARESKSVANSN